MSSDKNGLLGYIRNINPQVIYQGCTSHMFNLTSEEACKLLEPTFEHLNNFAVISKDSINRIEKWHEIVAELHRTYNDIDIRKMPVQISETRWLGKQKASDSVMRNETSFIAMYKQIHCLHTLPELKSKSDAVRDKVTNMFQFWSNYDNIVKAHMVNQVLYLCKRTTIHLQKASLQIYDMVNEISKLYDDLTNLLTTQKYSKILANAITFADNISNIINTEQILIKKDASSSDWLQKFANYFSEFVKKIQSGLQFRCIDNFKNNIQFFKEIQQLDPSTFKTIDLEKISFEKLCAGAGTNPEKTLTQFKSLVLTYIDSMLDKDNDDESLFGEKVNTIIKFLCQDNIEKDYIEILKVYTFVLSLPCTEVKCERDFSHLRYVKRYTRSTMSDEFLEIEMLIKLNKDLLSGINLEDMVTTIGLTSNKLKRLLLN